MEGILLPQCNVARTPSVECCSCDQKVKEESARACQMAPSGPLSLPCADRRELKEMGKGSNEKTSVAAVVPTN